MDHVIASIGSEYRRYAALADAAMAQLTDDALGERGPNDTNSVAVIAWHLAGNLASRFTDFLTTDGEKPWRDRDDEFARRTPTRAELETHWRHGWTVLFETLAQLSDADLPRPVAIRGVTLPVHAALHRSLAHAAYHVGQLVYLAKALLGSAWQSLSIPPGGSADYAANPTHERGDDHASRLRQRPDR